MPGSEGLEDFGHLEVCGGLGVAVPNKLFNISRCGGGISFNGMFCKRASTTVHESGLA